MGRCLYIRFCGADERKTASPLCRETHLRTVRSVGTSSILKGRAPGLSLDLTWVSYGGRSGTTAMVYTRGTIGFNPASTTPSLPSGLFGTAVKSAP